MKTFMANPAKIDRKWYVVDAEGKTLGRRRPRPRWPSRPCDSLGQAGYGLQDPQGEEPHQ